MRRVRRAAAQVRGWNEEDECHRRNCRQAERFRSRADEDMRRDRPARLFLMIEDRTGPHRQVNVMVREVRVQRLAVMVLRFVGVEMHVHQRRADGANLHEHDEGGRGQPAKHPAIVVKDCSRWHLTIS